MLATVSIGPSYGVAAGIVVVFLGLVYFTCGTGPNGVHRFWNLLLGQDGRTSTSKVQFALWTVSLAYGLLVIIIHLGSYTNQTLDPRYLLLLGFPAGAAIGAKVITTGQLDAGTIAKPQANPATTSVASSVADIVRNDQGGADLGDAQYLIFNLVALVAFWVAFAHDPTKLPVLSDTLVALTGVSASAYVVKKAAWTQPIAITGVVPSVAVPGANVTITGTNLDDGTGLAPTVYIDGQAAAVGNFGPSQLVVTVPPIPPRVPPGPRAVVVDLLSPTGNRTASALGKLTV
jgi:hypothetical protein